jgi:hypothetical protein
VVWDRRESETTYAYRCFCCYRDLGPDRTLAAAYHACQPSFHGDRVPGHVADWSRDHDWVQRAEAYDDHLEGIRRRAYERQQRDLAARRAAFELQNQERLERNVQELDQLVLATIESTRQDARPGEGSETHEGPDLAKLAKLAATAAELARQAIEGPQKKPAPTPTETDKPTATNEGPTAIVWIDATSPNSSSSDTPPLATNEPSTT